MARTFDNVVSLFYSKEEKEVQEKCRSQIENFKERMAENNQSVKNVEVKMEDLNKLF